MLLSTDSVTPNQELQYPSFTQNISDDMNVGTCNTFWQLAYNCKRRIMLIILCAFEIYFYR